MENKEKTYQCMGCDSTFTAEADLLGRVFCPECGCLIVRKDEE